MQKPRLKFLISGFSNAGSYCSQKHVIKITVVELMDETFRDDSLIFVSLSNSNFCLGVNVII